MGIADVFKARRELMVYPPKFVGFSPSVEHYATVFAGTFPQRRSTALFTGVASIVVKGILCAILAAYALTRYVFKGKKMLFYVILSGIPLSMGSAAMVVPNYMLFSILGMNNQWYKSLPLIYIAYNIPMSVWIMVGGMQEKYPTPLKRRSDRWGL